MKSQKYRSIPTTSRNPVRWNCTYHQSERITNFCLSEQCLLPLCPQCVKSHQHQHYKSNTYAQFDVIDNVVNNIKIQLLQKLEKGQNMKKMIEVFIKNKGNQMNQIVASLRQFKQQFITIINEKFNTLEEEIKKTIIFEHQSYKSQVETALFLLNHLIESSKKNISSLSTTQGIQAILNTYTQLRKKQLSVNTSFENVQKSMVKHSATIDKNCISKVIQDIGQSIQINTIQMPNIQLITSILTSNKKQVTANCLSLLNQNINNENTLNKPQGLMERLSKTTQSLQNQLNTFGSNKFQIY